MMRKTRFMSLVFLVLSLSFFFVGEFREGISAGMGPLLYRNSPSGWWIASAGQVPVPTLDRLAARAEQDSDGLTLGFVALQHPDAEMRIRLANLAVDLDSELTWLYYAMNPASQPDPVAQDWLDKLEAWDKDNSIPHLARAEYVFGSQGLEKYRGIHPTVLQTLSDAEAWSGAMARAYAAPRYDSYHFRLFDLIRGVMRKQDLMEPAVLLKMMADAPVVNLTNNSAYANVVVFKYGKDAETAGRPAEAATHYQSVVHFGERMQASGTSLIETLIGQSLVQIASQRLVPLWRRTGRADEAESLETRVAGFKQTYPYFSPLGQTSHNLWHALLVVLLAALSLIFLAFTLISVAYTNAKRWTRTHIRGRIFEFLTVSENYAPVLLFMACLGLYLIYYPYAINFQHYMTVTEEIYDFEPLFWNVLPTMMFLPGSSPALDIGNPFSPYLWVALAGLLLAIAYIIYERNQADKPRPFDLKPPKD